VPGMERQELAEHRALLPRPRAARGHRPPPVAPALHAHQREDDVEHGGQGQALDGVQRDVDRVRRDPDEPVLEVLARLHPHGREAERGRDRVGERGGVADRPQVEEHAVARGRGRRGEDGGLGSAHTRDRPRRAAACAVTPVPPAPRAERDVDELQGGVGEEARVREQHEEEAGVRDPGRPGPDALADEQPDRERAGDEAKRLRHGEGKRAGRGARDQKRGHGRADEPVGSVLDVCEVCHLGLLVGFRREAVRPSWARELDQERPLLSCCSQGSRFTPHSQKPSDDAMFARSESAASSTGSGA
jgi:hypothetical protein